MPAITGSKTQAELREIVRKERLFELANEGFRMVDLRRWKLADKLMNSTLYGRIPKGLLANAPIIDTDSQVNYNNVANKKDMRIIEIRKFDANKNYLWPIRNIEIVTNKNVEQNPGYKIENEMRKTLIVAIVLLSAFVHIVRAQYDK